MKLLTTLLATTVIAFAVAPAVHAQAVCQGDCLLTGGEKGDYYRFFAPPVQKLLRKGWADVPIATSTGTPASIAYVEANPKSYMLGQGDIVAIALKNPDTAAKLKIVRSTGIGNEAVLAIMSPAMYERSHGSWGALAQHATQVRFVTASADSGPGATMQSLMALDPTHLGRATPSYLASMDDAIDAVVMGRADVALLVQFANPANPRFKAVAEKGLKFAPVMMGAMRDLKFPDGSPAYVACDNVDVGGGVTIETTACTPIQLVTGASNDNKDADAVLASARPEDLRPQDSAFASIWAKVKAKTASATASAWSLADAAAAKVGM